MPPPNDFRAALGGSRLSVIAEVKRRSPSAGDLAFGLDPADIARQYIGGGASAISVLTDEQYFGGSIADLMAVRDLGTTPVLRKDFTVSERDIYDARLIGADAVLLIVAALDDDELRRFHQCATAIGLAVLVEVHDEAELNRALPIEPAIVGVNQRNLKTFDVDTDLAVSLRAKIPSGVAAVAESGIASIADAEVMADAGFDAVLVGTSLVTSSNAADAVAALAALEVKRCS